MFALTQGRQAACLLLALSCPLFCGAAAAEGGDKPADYARVMALTVSGKQAIVQLPLPRAVYLAARTADLRDLRVFDAAGASMPFALTTAPAQVQDKARTMAAPVAVFPVRAPAQSDGRLQDSLQIRTGADGAVISVTAPAGRKADDVLASLVLDMHPGAQAGVAAPVSAPISAIALTLPAGVVNYSAHLVLETSDDLQRWEELADGSVSWLVNSQGATVRKHRIAFAPRAFRYARLRWLEGQPIEFATVSADYVAPSAGVPARESLVLQPVNGKVEGDLVYAAPIAIPVEALGLQFHGQNVVMPALVGQYQWVRERSEGVVTRLQPLVNTTFYQMTQNGQQRASGDVELPPTHAREWVVRPQARVADRPELRLRWTGASMVFLAGGKPPYSLAVGRDGAQSVQVPLEQVAPGFSRQELAALERAQAGTPVVQHDAEQAAAGAQDAATTRTRWLWALLVCGVAALAAMAWQLSRQLKANGNNGADGSGSPPG